MLIGFWLARRPVLSILEGTACSIYRAGKLLFSLPDFCLVSYLAEANSSQLEQRTTILSALVFVLARVPHTIVAGGGDRVPAGQYGDRGARTSASFPVLPRAADQVYEQYSTTSERKRFSDKLESCCLELGACCLFVQRRLAEILLLASHPTSAVQVLQQLQTTITRGRRATLTREELRVMPSDTATYEPTGKA